MAGAVGEHQLPRARRRFAERGIQGAALQPFTHRLDEICEISRQFDVQGECRGVLRKIRDVDVFVEPFGDDARHPDLERMLRRVLQLSAARVLVGVHAGHSQQVVAQPRMLLDIRERVRLRCASIDEYHVPRQHARFMHEQPVR